VDELSQGELRLWPVTLYGTLDELTDKGWIQALDDPRDRPPGESERKRYFRITRTGRRALELEAARLAALAGTAHRRLLSTGETR
jgi:DNA-binding PadR family transcriptional regulator